MCTPEAWRSGGVARSPSHESVTTDLSLFSVSSAASDARVLRLLACRAGQGPDPSLRVASPNPDSKALKRPSSTLPLQSTDNCRELLAGCAALCKQLGLRRSFSAGDVADVKPGAHMRSATSEVGLCAAIEALTLSAASRSCSTWVAVGGSQLPSPQRSQPTQPQQRPLPTDNKKVRQNYIKRRLLTTYRALERMSQSDFNLDRLEAAAVSAVASAVSGPGPTTLTVPQKHPHARFVHPAVTIAYGHLQHQSCYKCAAALLRETGTWSLMSEHNSRFLWRHTLDQGW
ncbi:hypothetical protein K1T71_014353 [Dendrolimus kikuchii]|uniref:Uncharacterized protein n=1 Tax=Dendrolimus kikuchii TaxID=765133 RepID=A0ACC1CE47_9NEOP|nr:hypothetical protein K1T71_014353 [Dendrolimus kikuchii]